MICYSSLLIYFGVSAYELTKKSKDARKPAFYPTAHFSFAFDCIVGLEKHKLFKLDFSLLIVFSILLIRHRKLHVDMSEKHDSVV
ncbi:hypothetical protein ACB092_02G186600 [Castanea dentata]